MTPVYKTIAVRPDTYKKVEKARKAESKKHKRRVTFDEVLRDKFKKTKKIVW